MSGFKAQVSRISFAGTDAAAVVNSWVAEKTNQKILDIIQPNSLGSDDLMVLLNAIYIKGLWEKDFDVSATMPGNFSVFRRNMWSVTKVPMMKTSGGFRIFENETWKGLRMPLRYSDLAFYVVVPKRQYVQYFVRDLKPNTLPRFISKIKVSDFQNIHLFVPKFRIASTSNLNRPLMALGMRSAFSPGYHSQDARFLGVSDDPSVHISSVNQKTYIDVNEKGLEAAAVTSVVVSTTSLPPEPTYTFRVDKPFLFFIVDETNNQILFAGNVLKP
jgi:serpin B